jgi:predicted ATPase/class 3 adenylate cyclase
MICLACKSHNPDGNQFCGHCGTPLTAIGLLSAGPAAMPEREGGERRRVVLMFSDIASSTEIAARLDPEDWRELLVDYHQAAAAAITDMGGVVAQYLGDGVLAYFGWPIAHENDAERAALAGHTILDAARALNRANAERKRGTLSIRIGIHVGEVVVTRSGYVYGDATSVAARVQAIADPDSVVVTEPVFRSIGRRVAMEDLGERLLRGLDRKTRLYRVLPPRRPQPSPRLVMAPGQFIGRSNELQTLLDLWSRARADQGQVVMVTGEAGVGKSRLVRELQTRIRGTPHVWLESAGSEIFRSTPFYPVVRLLDRLFGASDLEQSPGRRRRLGHLLAAVGVDDSESISAVGGLGIGLHEAEPADGSRAVERRDRQLRTLVALTLHGIRRRPGVVVLEDLHWVDPSTLELVDALIASAVNAPILIVLTARPEFRASWSTRRRIDSITLNPLSLDEVRELVRSTIASASLADDVIESIAERTSGIPLFAEELARLVKTRERSVTTGEIPSSLAALLNARLDEVGSAREVAQIAAVIGDEISADVLQVVSAREADELGGSLDRLTGAEILVARETPAGRVFAFTHALFRDATYGTLLRSRRRELHERVANAIAAEFPVRANTHPEIVARHFALAGQHGRAATVWHQAGVLAISRSAYREAEAACQEALSSLLGMPETAERDGLHVKIQRTLLSVLPITQGWAAPKTAEAADRARELSENSGDLEQLLVEAGGRWAALSSTGGYLGASRVAEQFAELAQRDGRPYGLANAGMILMTSRYRLGDLLGAERHFREAESLLADESFVRQPGAIAQTFGNAARNAWMLGCSDEARRRMTHAVAIATAGGNPYDIAFAQYMDAILAVLMRQPRQAQGAAERAMDLSDTNGFRPFAAISRVVLGRALVETTPSSDAVDLINDGIARMAETGSRVAMTLYLAWLAEAQAVVVSPEAALGTINRALTFNAEELFFRPELFRIRGELWAAAGNVDRAEADIQAALTTAITMAALGLQLRAAMSLHRLRSRGGSAGASDVVASVYERMREGHDTADLVDAAWIVRRAL